MNNNGRGMTLVETLVSVLILSFMIIGVITLVAQAVSISSRVSYEYIGTNLAKKRLEDARAIIKASGFNSLVNMRETTEKRVDAEGNPDSDGEFLRKTTVTEDYDENFLLTYMQVEVSYYLRGVKSRNPITMTTIFARME